MINRIPNNKPVVDIMDNCARWETKVHEHGFLALVDVMPRFVPEGRTADYAIVQAARLSYGSDLKSLEEDRGLIRYLMRHRHTTPFEMVELKFHCAMPIFVARQWIRHRTACLGGNVELHFDLPSGIQRKGNQLYKLKIKDVYDRFLDSSGFKRERLQNMFLRSVNEETFGIQHTHIVDIWESGVKALYSVTLRGGSTCDMSEDHLCLTDSGWKTLKQFTVLQQNRDARIDSYAKILSVGPGLENGIVPILIEPNEISEVWLPVVDWEEYYEVSNQGRVKRIGEGRGSNSGKIKTPTLSQGKFVVSLSSPGRSSVLCSVAVLVLKAFVGPQPFGFESCHEDGNCGHNYAKNLR